MGHQDSTPATPRDRLLNAAAATWALDPSASLETIARAAGVGRATLHRYFASRTDLMRATALEGIAALDAALDAADYRALPPAQALRAVVDVLVRFGDRLHFLLVTGDLLGDPSVSAAEAEIDARLHGVLEHAVAAGVLRGDTPSAWRFRALEALVYAAWTAVAGGELARLDAPALVYDTFLRGLGAPAPKTGRRK